MPMPQLRKGTSDDRALSILQDSLDVIFSWLRGKQHLDAEVVTDVSLTSGTATTVPHKLGRKYTGWIVVRKNANADVWESASLSPSLYINLNTSANVEVDLLVF